MNNLTRKIFPIVVGLSIGLSVAMLVHHIFFTTEPSYKDELKKAATAITKSCPVMVDEETRLDRVEVKGENTLRYTYTLVLMKKSDIDAAELKNSLRPAILKEVATSQQLAINREHLTTMVYAYHDKDGVFLFDITITPEMYQDNHE